MRSTSIVGAGIAGLTSALCLARAGFRVDLFEQSGRVQPVGAGIQLSPNALRVLRRIGCLDSVAASAVSADEVILRDGRTGRRLAGVPVRGFDGTPYLSIHRADLHAALLAAATASPAITLHLGHALHACRDTAGGMLLTFERDGQAVQHVSPLVIAADGVRSAIAQSLGMPAAVQTGYAAWRLMMPASSIADPPAGVQAWLDRRWHAVAYPVCAGREVNLVLVARLAGAAEAGKQALIDMVPAENAALRQLLDAGELIGCWPMAGAPQDRPYRHGGSVALVGDAAHAMLPFAAQGAAMGIEDAAVLAACLRQDATGETAQETALHHYEALRRPRIARVLGRVRLHDFIYHLGAPASMARNAVMHRVSPARLGRSLAWLYDWEPPEFAAPAFETPQGAPS